MGPQQGTPQIFARIQASLGRRLQEEEEDTKKQGDQGLQGSRGME